MSQQPVTVIVSRRVKKSDVQAFEKLCNQMTECASHFDGYVSTAILRPINVDDPEYRIIFKFVDKQTLAKWEASEQRAEILQEIESLLVEPGEREEISGLVTWFSLPSKNPLTPPPRYKMTLVSWLALYPAVTLIFLAFEPWLVHIPLPLRTLLVTVVVIVLMSYVLMPLMTRLFAFWLYPERQRR